MTIPGILEEGRRMGGVNTQCKRRVSAGRIHFARGFEMSLGGHRKRRSLLWGAAGAHIAELLKTMLEKKASGVELAQMERGVGA